MKITCNRCIKDVDPRIVKGTHITAYCSECGSYIKHLPKDRSHQKDFTLPFGKFKGIAISDMHSKERIDYLKWVLRNVSQLKDWQKEIIKNKITSLPDPVR
jgi:uncharacterized protein (DUF3820 family)